MNLLAKYAKCKICISLGLVADVALRRLSQTFIKQKRQKELGFLWAWDFGHYFVILSTFDMMNMEYLYLGHMTLMVHIRWLDCPRRVYYSSLDVKIQNKQECAVRGLVCP